MAEVPSSKYQKYIIVACIAFLFVFMVWIRLLPSFSIGSQDIIGFVASDDPLYNLRQVDLMRANAFGYAWFDPMTLFPIGSTIYWGPMLIYLITALCAITGVTARADVIYTALIVPPIIAAAMVPVMYYIGKTLSDWKTGLFAAALIAVVSGQFFYRSLFGYLDHHILEAFSSALFSLCYIAALVYMKKNPVDLRKLDTIRIPLMLAAVTGAAYVFGLITMPTMILFALIVAAFTLVQFVWDFWNDRSTEGLVLLNLVVFVIAILGLLAFGIKHEGIDLSRYTIGHVYAYCALILGTVALYILARTLRGRPKYMYPAALAGVGIIAAVTIWVVVPAIFDLLIASLFAFFGQQAVTLTVEEARAWSADAAWRSFNVGLILMAGGFIVLAWRNWKEEHPEGMYILVWTVVMLLATIQHVRYEYYLGVNIALLAGIFMGAVVNAGGKEFRGFLNARITTEEEKEVVTSRSAKKKKKGQKSSVAAQSDFPKILLVFVGIILTLSFAYISLQGNFVAASSGVFGQEQYLVDWRETLSWMNQNTPDPGVDYLKIYDQKTFSYPSSSYGVMSWWDYGHMITYLGRRIPNANPFQQGVSGELGAASFFMTGSEDAAAHIADTLGTKYVITDIHMDITKFWAMATWYNSTAAETPYRTTFLIPGADAASQYSAVGLYTKQYYTTMVARLHTFDGSMTDGDTAYLLEYTISQVGDVSIPVITNSQEMPLEQAYQRAETYNNTAPQGSYATVAQKEGAFFLPTTRVPALRHFRLVHESPNNVFTTGLPDIKYVKAFEYVKGAHIRGEGIIALDLVTNTGRNFTYRQESVNGEFVVPYATVGSTDQVHALGKYRITGTSTQIDVSEEAVEQGLTVS
ncbi:MAG: oligosaccharyl transferase, archaeosortase A system-associated [Methanomicrobiales archaeon]|nr:oligosaccharyl transferase, archaeosortase A system-associated [Methanomicrobiales archaeon]